GNKFRIGGRALNQEWHCCPALATATASATGGFAKKAAKVRDWASGGAERARKRSDHFEIKVVLGVDRTSAGKISDCRNNGEEIFRLKTIGRHAEIGGELFNIQILAALDTRQRGNRTHFRPKIKARELSVEETDVPGSNQLVQWAC